MSNIKFTIRKVFSGSEKQKAVGIHATFNMSVDGPDGIIVALNDMKLMKSRAGDYYIASAFRSYEGKDRETGAAKQMKINYASLFPEKENWDKKDAIVQLVINELKKDNSNGGGNTTQAKPAQASSGGGSVADDQPW